MSMTGISWMRVTTMPFLLPHVLVWRLTCGSETVQRPLLLDVFGVTCSMVGRLTITLPY